MHAYALQVRGAIWDPSRESEEEDIETSKEESSTDTDLNVTAFCIHDTQDECFLALSPGNRSGTKWISRVRLSTGASLQRWRYHASSPSTEDQSDAVVTSLFHSTSKSCHVLTALTSRGDSAVYRADLGCAYASDGGLARPPPKQRWLSLRRTLSACVDESSNTFIVFGVKRAHLSEGGGGSRSDATQLQALVAQPGKRVAYSSLKRETSKGSYPPKKTTMISSIACAPTNPMGGGAVAVAWSDGSLQVWRFAPGGLRPDEARSHAGKVSAHVATASVKLQAKLDASAGNNNNRTSARYLFSSKGTGTSVVGNATTLVSSLSWRAYDAQRCLLGAHEQDSARTTIWSWCADRSNAEDPGVLTCVRRVETTGPRSSLLLHPGHPVALTVTTDADLIVSVTDLETNVRSARSTGLYPESSSTTSAGLAEAPEESKKPEEDAPRLPAEKGGKRRFSAGAFFPSWFRGDSAETNSSKKKKRNSLNIISAPTPTNSMSLRASSSRAGPFAALEDDVDPEETLLPTALKSESAKKTTTTTKPRRREPSKRYLVELHASKFLDVVVAVVSGSSWSSLGLKEVRIEPRGQRGPECFPLHAAGWGARFDVPTQPEGLFGARLTRFETGQSYPLATNVRVSSFDVHEDATSGLVSFLLRSHGLFAWLTLDPRSGRMRATEFDKATDCARVSRDRVLVIQGGEYAHCKRLSAQDSPKKSKHPLYDTPYLMTERASAKIALQLEVRRVFGTPVAAGGAPAPDDAEGDVVLYAAYEPSSSVSPRDMLVYSRNVSKTHASKDPDDLFLHVPSSMIKMRNRAIERKRSQSVVPSPSRRLSSAPETPTHHASNPNEPRRVSVSRRLSAYMSVDDVKAATTTASADGAAAEEEELEVPPHFVSELPEERFVSVAFRLAGGTLSTSRVGVLTTHRVLILNAETLALMAVSWVRASSCCWLDDAVLAYTAFPGTHVVERLRVGETRGAPLLSLPLRARTAYGLLRGSADRVEFCAAHEGVFETSQRAVSLESDEAETSDAEIEVLEARFAAKRQYWSWYRRLLAELERGDAARRDEARAALRRLGGVSAALRAAVAEVLVEPSSEVSSATPHAARTGSVATDAALERVSSRTGARTARSRRASTSEDVSKDASRVARRPRRGPACDLWEMDPTYASVDESRLASVAQWMAGNAPRVEPTSPPAIIRSVLESTDVSHQLRALAEREGPAFPGSSAINGDDACLGYWRFEEPDEIRATCGVKDSSRYERDGLLSSTAARGFAVEDIAESCSMMEMGGRRRPHALRLMGLGGMSVPGLPRLGIHRRDDAGFRAFTVEAWIRTSQTGGTLFRVEREWAVRVEAETGRLVFWFEASPESELRVKTPSVSDGEWHHVAFSLRAFDDARGDEVCKAQFVVDGYIRATDEALAVPPSDLDDASTTTLEVGPDFDGDFLEVRYWGCERDAWDIETYMQTYLNLADRVRLRLSVSTPKAGEWEKIFDHESESFYWFNAKSGQVSWTEPS